MPKNIVGRLLNLENEIKSVISFCELSNNEQKSSKPVQKRGKSLIRNSLSNADHTRCNPAKSSNGQSSCKTEKSVEKSHQKEKKTTGCQRRRSMIEKPNSAPPGALSTIDEATNDATRTISMQRASKNEGVPSADSIEWFDCSPQTYETSEQTLRPAEQILTDISQYGNENYLPKHLTLSCGSCRRRKLDCVCLGKPHWATYYLSIENDDKPSEVTHNQSKESFLQYIKPDLKENTVINELARKMEKSENEVMSAMREEHCKFACRTVHGNASQNEMKTGTKNSEDKRQLRMSRVESGHFDNTRRPDVSSRSSGRPMTAPVKSWTSEANQPRQETTKSSLHVDQDGQENSAPAENSEESDENKKFGCGADDLGEIENIEEFNNTINDRNYVQWIKNVMNEEQDVESEEESLGKMLEDLQVLKQTKSLSPSTRRKIDEIIEKNYSKVESMRRSRLHALNTVKYMREKYEALAEMKDDLAAKLEILIVKNEKLMMELQEAEDVKRRMFEEWQKQNQGNSSTHLINRLQRVNEENMQQREKIQLLERQLQERIRSEERAKNTELNETSEAFQMNQDKCYEYHLLFKRQETAYRRLVQGIAVLEKVIRNNKEKEKRLSDIKAELKRRAVKTQWYLEKLTAEKTNLYHVVNELQAYVQEHQSRIEQLQDEISKKDEEIENRKKMMEEKTETLEETNRELESIRKNSTHLEDQVKTLRNSIEHFDQMHQNLLRERQGFEETVRKVKEENEKLQEQISVEKESILIKNKIIEDQQDTIKQLREKSEEAKTMVHKIQSLERLLDAERDDKLELEEIVERLKRKKDELKQKVKSLESDLLLAPQEVVRDLQKTQIFLHELENQVQTKQKEWEVLVQSLAKEKEEACSVAVFATKKLIQTTSDFQRQSDAYKKLYRILTENLMERKRHLQEANDKAKQSVRFSDLHQESIEGYDEQMMRNAERFRHQAKPLGILKKNKEWFDNLPESSSSSRDFPRKWPNLRKDWPDPGRKKTISSSETEIIDQKNVQLD